MLTYCMSAIQSLAWQQEYETRECFVLYRTIARGECCELLPSIRQAEQRQRDLERLTQAGGAVWRHIRLEPLEASLEHFQRLIDAHDLTYQYSDDHRAWQRGDVERARIHRLAAQLPREDVAQAWNALIDRSLGEAHRQQWYWR